MLKQWTVVGASVLAAALSAWVGPLVPTTRLAPPRPAGTPSRSPQLPPSIPFGAGHAMVMLSATTGVVWGYAQGIFSLWTTADGGQHWQPYRVAAAPARTAVDQIVPVVDFLSSHIGWIAWVEPGSSTSTLHVLRTYDGGRHWAPSTQSVPPVVFQAAQVTFLTHRDGWIRTWSQAAAFYQDPSILRTTTGGRTWRLVSSATGYIPNPRATPDALPDVTQPLPMAFATRQVGWVAAGSVAAPQATLYHTVTAGARWSPVPLPMPPGARHARGAQAYPPVFSGPDGDVLIQLTDGTTASANAVVMERSTNHGRTWTPGALLAVPGQSWNIVSSLVNPHQGWVIGANGVPFAHTTNGGQSWRTIPLPRSLKTLLAHHYAIQQLDMVTPHVGWIMLQRSVGENGGAITRFFKTTDGGRTWSDQSVGS